MLDLTKIEINKRCYLDNVRDMRGQARISERERERGGCTINVFSLITFKCIISQGMDVAVNEFYQNRHSFQKSIKFSKC